MADKGTPHFHNEPGVPVIHVGAKEFMCIGAPPPLDHPHVFLDMGSDERDHLLLLLDPVPVRSVPRRAARRARAECLWEADPPPLRHRADVVGALSIGDRRRRHRRPDGGPGALARAGMRSR